MAILIRVANSDGVVGQCDAKCYGAHEPRCSCICGGENHGVGLTKALANTRAIVETVGQRGQVQTHMDPRANQTVFVGILE